MHYQEFIAKYQGQYLDWDGAYGAQCVDLFRYYCKQVLGISQPKGVTGAKDFWTNYQTDSSLYNNFERIPNTPDFVPQPGDVWIWTAAYGKYGHIAIESYASATTSQFQCFSQNDPAGSPCVLKDYKYTKVYGVLRPKNQQNIRLNSGTSTGSTQGVSMTENIDWSWFGKPEVDNWDALKKLLIEYLGEKEDKCAYGDPETVNHGHLGDERRKVKTLETQIGNQTHNLDKLNDTIASLEKQLAEARQDADYYRDEKYECEDECERLQKQVNTLDQTVIDKNKRIDELEDELARAHAGEVLRDGQDEGGASEYVASLEAELRALKSRSLWDLLVERLKQLLG